MDATTDTASLEKNLEKNLDFIRLYNSELAEKITAIDLREAPSVADYFIVCEGETDVQNRAIADGIIDRCSERNTIRWHYEGESEGRWVEDLERGIMPKIDPYPWQTDTSIGDWFYDRNWKFRPVSWVIHMLVDNVSKNGNLLLNIVQRPDGSLDPEVEDMLQQLAKWNAIHGEAIYGTRPWLV